MSPQPNRYETCAAHYCARTPRPFSRYCRIHHRRLEATRSLTGRVIRKGELRCYREIARGWLEARAAHPAVVGAQAFMATFLRDDGKAGFLRAEFNRLAANGATPRSMLASVMAMYLWQERAREHMDDRCYWLNVGRAVLGTVPAKRRTSRNGKPYSVRVRPGHAEALGRHIAQNIGGFALIAARHALAEIDPEPPKAILQALKDEPL